MRTKLRHPGPVIVCSLLLCSTALSGQQPRILLIGDSISIGYTAEVKRLLSGDAEVVRVRGNAGDTARGLRRIDDWLDARHGSWDLIHFNWGLWDLCYRRPGAMSSGRRDKVKGTLTATLGQYEKNLRQLVAKLERTGADLIFATTTPVPRDEVGRKLGDAQRYNAVARKIMRERGIAIDDLHRLVGDAMARLARQPGDVHFHAAGYQLLAKQVARSVRRSLRQRRAGKRDKGVAGPDWQATRHLVYQTLGSSAAKVELRLSVFEPEHHQRSDRRPAMVFFFGGGWVGGSPQQFYPHCEYLAERGMVAISAEYRVQRRHNTTPFECVADGKAAIRWVRQHAAQLGVDAAHIAAGGGSAGGHVAAATALTPKLDRPAQAVSSRPDALVLFNPVYDNSPDGYGNQRVKARWRAISPLHNISKTAPPSLVFLGTRDRLIPVSTAREFQRRMRAVDVRSELQLFTGRAHGFFNHGRGDGKDYQATVHAMDAFLGSLGFLDGPPRPLR